MQISRIEFKIGKFLSPIPLTPNQWTLISFLAGIVGFISFIKNDILVGCLFFLVSFILDIVDGSVAKYRSVQTPFGDYLDGISDVAVDSLFLIGLWIIGYPSLNILGYGLGSDYILFICLVGMFLTSFAKSHAAYSNVHWRSKLDKMHGLLQRGERSALLFFAAVILLIDPYITSYLLLLTGLLSIFTVFQRFLFVYSLD